MASSSELRAPVATVKRTNTEPGDGSWSVAHRALFRFFFVFLLLTVFPFPFNSFGGSFYEIGWYEKIWFAASSWLCLHMLHVTPASAKTAPLFLVDTANGYVELASIFALSIMAAILWTLIDKKSRDYHTLDGWLRVYVRYALAFTMLGYGMDKVFALQFNTSLPGPGRLAQPLGNYSPFALMWTFMAYSKPYTIFAGAGEVIGGVLLLFRRTTTLGALIICGVMANVVALDTFYDVGLKLLSGFYLLLAILLLADDLPRLVNFFVLNRPAPAANLNGPIPDDWMKKPRIILHTAVVILALYYFAGPGLKWPRERGNRPKSPLYGLYQVESFTQNGEPLKSSDGNWRRVIFELKGDMTVLSMDDTMHYYGADVDMSKNTLTVSGEYPYLRSSDGNYSDDKSPKSILKYSVPDPDHLQLRGDLLGQSVVIELRKVDISQFTLASRGFRWVGNGFYR